MMKLLDPTFRTETTLILDLLSQEDGLDKLGISTNLSKL
jgi:hypothetical protein